MKTIQNCRNIFVAAVFVSLLAACEAKNNQTEFEARERGKIGKVYDPTQQGNLHETGKISSRAAVTAMARVWKALKPELKQTLLK